MKSFKILLLVASVVAFLGCDDLLEEETFSSVETDEFLNTQQGIEGALIQAYSHTRLGENAINRYTHLDLLSTGTATYLVDGDWANFALTLQNWDWTQPTFTSEWNRWYDVILYANTVLEFADNGDFSQEFKDRVMGEAYALRGYAYFELYSYFGRLPLYTGLTPDNSGVGRSSVEETQAQIENDFLSAIPLLSEDPIADNLEYGRVYKNSARGMLVKHYLNTKQWQKCADMALELINSGVNDLHPNYADIFSTTNESFDNKEILWVLPSMSNEPNLMNNLAAMAYPRGFRSSSAQTFFLATMHIPDSIVDFFGPNDDRGRLLLRTYAVGNNDEVRGYGRDRSIQSKWALDPNAEGFSAGNDFPLLRYADILLARAEALNELNGPSAEAVDLINSVRTRASANPINPANFNTRQSLRNFLLRERLRELHYEGKTRQDLIRYGTYFSGAQQRGVIGAEQHEELFPIPIVEIDNNDDPEMVQNPGYSD